MGEATTMMCLKHFMKALYKVFGSEYLRSPTSANVKHLLSKNSERGFPGMLISIDSLHWKWKNGLVAWQGPFTGHKGSPTMIIEEIALAKSNVFEGLLCGIARPVNFLVNRNQYTMGYYLAGVIYPKYVTIVKSMKRPRLAKEKFLSERQESVKKDIKRAFGILQAHFAYLRYPNILWEMADLYVIMMACIIMHNMIIEDER